MNHHEKFLWVPISLNLAALNQIKVKILQIVDILEEMIFTSKIIYYIMINWKSFIESSLTLGDAGLY